MGGVDFWGTTLHVITNHPVSSHSVFFFAFRIRLLVYSHTFLTIHYCYQLMQWPKINEPSDLRGTTTWQGLRIPRSSSWCGCRSSWEGSVRAPPRTTEFLSTPPILLLGVNLPPTTPLVSPPRLRGWRGIFPNLLELTAELLPLSTKSSTTESRASRRTPCLRSLGQRLSKPFFCCE